MIRLTLAILAACFALPCASFAASAPPKENLLANPGFEEPEGWRPNNWAKNDAEFARDPENPRSGKFSQRLTLRRALHANNIQFIQDLPGRLERGEQLQLRLWLRGPENGNPIKVALQKRGSPWTEYYNALIAPKDTWKEHVLNFRVPDNTDTSDIGLYFYLLQENSVWLDDVSLVRLPPQAGGEPLVGNQVVNGSFEVGKERWYGNFTGRYDPEATEKNAGLDLESVPVADAPHGKRALRFTVAPECSVEVTPAYFDLRYGHPAAASFYVKSSSAGRTFQAHLGAGNFARNTRVSRSFTTQGTGWERFTFPATPVPSERGTYFLALRFNEPGDYWLDAVSVTEGAEAPAAYADRPGAVGWSPVRGAPIANLYDRGSPIAFEITAEPPAGADSRAKAVELQGRVIDVRGAVLKEFRLSLPRRAGEATASLLLEGLPSDKYGAFLCQLRHAGAPVEDLPALEIPYQVLPVLKPLREVTDSFYGGHPGFAPRSLAIAERVGIRWVRLHPPWDTKWVSVERQPDVWTFPTTGVRRAREQGFRVLGNFDWTPVFRADVPEGTKKTWRGYGSYPPKDWAAWRTYVSKSIEAFRPWIDTWEIWNEPDLDVFMVAPAHLGLSKPELYQRFVRETRAAVDAAGADVRLVAGAVAQPESSFVSTWLDKNPATEVDVLSFHDYSMEPVLAQPLIDRMRAQTNRRGETPEVWMSEGAYTAAITNWQRTPRVPEASPEAAGALCSGFARTLAYFKAAGVAKYFLYPAPFAHQAGRLVYRNDFAYGDDVSGQLLPHWAAYAASVLFLEDAAPAGFRREGEGESAVFVASFVGKTHDIEVVWSNVEQPMGARANVAGRRAFDMMGNPVELTPDAKLTFEPLYLVTPRATPAKNG